MMKNEDIKDSFFKVLDSIYVFFVKGESALFVAFSKVILSQFYSYCTRNCNFLYFLETEIYYFVFEIFYVCNNKNGSRKTLITR